MRLIFCGTPDFAASALQALLQAGFDIPLVFTQPDRPAGRGMKMHMSAVKQLALAHHIPVLQPQGLKLDGKFAEQAQSAKIAIENVRADGIIVAAYGLILPTWMLNMTRLGCLNIHASLLPRWRGAAPIQRAIEAGDAQTGITIMHMDEGLDTGDIGLVERLPIAADETTATLHDKLAALGARLIVEALELAACGGTLPRKPQSDFDSSAITYAHKIDKTQAALHWSRPAVQLHRQIRAFDPAPGCTAELPSPTGVVEKIKVWAAEPVENLAAWGPASAPAGQVLAADAQGVLVATGCGAALRLTQLQRAGGKRLAAAEFLRGWPIAVGQHFCVENVE